MEQFTDKLVIGLVGEKGGGKETFTRIFTELASPQAVGIEVFSAILRDTLDLWNIPQTRANLQKLPVVMREGYGASALSDALFHRVLSRRENIILLDGVRWETDEALIRRFPRNLLVCITADARVRWERTRLRGQKTDEKEASFEQFMEEEQAPTEILIPEIGSRADFKIENNGSPEDFRKKVQEFYNIHLKLH